LPPLCAKLIAPRSGQQDLAFFRLAGRLSNPVKRLNSVALTLTVMPRVAYFFFIFAGPHGYSLIS